MNSKRKKLVIATAIVVAAVMVAALAIAGRGASLQACRGAEACHGSPACREASRRLSAFGQARALLSAGSSRCRRRSIAFGRPARGCARAWSQPSQAYAGPPRAARDETRIRRKLAGRRRLRHGSFGSSGLVAQARQYVGTNPTGMGALWCARFMNMVLEKSGRRGTGSNMANSFANYGRRVSGPAGRRDRGDVARQARWACGHRVRASMRPEIRSSYREITTGAWRRRYIPRGRIYAYVMP